MRESALVLYRDELISVSRGQPSSVEFNFDDVWAYRKKHKDRFSAASLYWVHVHPSGFGTSPSTVDLLCAAGLKAAFGAVEHFGIICFSNPGFKDIQGLISWYRFAGDRFIKTAENDLESDHNLIEEEVFTLKALSYGELWQPQSESMALGPLAATS